MTTNKTLRKVFVVTLALVMVLTMSVSAFADSKISMKKAFSIALENAKLTSDEVRRVEKEWDDGAYSIEFTQKGSRTEYEYEISASGKILEKSVDYVYRHNYSKKKIGKKAGVYVETESEISFGRTVSDLYVHADELFKNKNVLVMLEVDRDRVAKLVMDTFKAY